MTEPPRTVSPRELAARDLEARAQLNERVVISDEFAKRLAKLLRERP